MSVYQHQQPARLPRNARVLSPGLRAAFYDLDGTLMDLNLVHAALFTFTNIGEWSRRVSYMMAFVSRLPRMYIAERRDRRLLNIVLFEAFKGVSRDRLFSLGEEYCERVLLAHIYPRAIEMIEANRAAGIEPVLVTGSPDFIVAPLAEHLGIDAFASNQFIFSRGRATGRLSEPIMAGEQKAVWCEKWVSERGMDLADCWGYADSHHDMAFLAAMGHPVAVNPDRRLKVVAMNRHWPVIHFKKQSAQSDDDFYNHYDFDQSTRETNGAT